MNALLTALDSFCKRFGFSVTYWVAFSGGLDSSVLLALCHALSTTYPIRFHVVHVDHRLHDHSQEWANFARNRAAYYQFPYTERVIKVARAQGESIEAYAREARYALCSELMQPQDVLLTAHHQDDQAETILLQLMRGAGIKGLAAMPEVKPFSQGVLGRPLLSFSRDKLLAVAKEQNLEWIDDSSNGNTVFARNYIRQEIMPLLKARWPTASLMLARSAGHCAVAQEVLDDYVALSDYAGAREGTLSVSKVMQCASKLRCLIIRKWIMQAGYYPPDQRQLDAIQESVLASRWDKMPAVSFAGMVVRRYRDDLYLNGDEVLAHSQSPSLSSYEWQLADVCMMPSIGRLESILQLGGEVPADITSLNVRFLPSSETIAVMGRCRRHSVKKLFQEWGVPPWLRNRTPLLFVRDELVGVPGYYWSHALQYQEEQKPKFKIIFHTNH